MKNPAPALKSTYVNRHNRHSLSTCRARSQTGQALAEFAIVIPVILLLLCNLMDFGRAMLCYNFVCGAARDAARYAATHGADSASPTTSSAVSNYVAGELPQGLSSSELTVT